MSDVLDMEARMFYLFLVQAYRVHATDRLHELTVASFPYIDDSSSRENIRQGYISAAGVEYDDFDPDDYSAIEQLKGRF